MSVPKPKPKPQPIITTFPALPGSVSVIHITKGPDGALWFIESIQSGQEVTEKIGRMTSQGKVTEFPLPPRTYLLLYGGITTGPDGALWFTEGLTAEVTERIGRITPQGKMTEFILPKPGGYPGAITTGPDGALWFTDEIARIGRITPQGKVTEFNLPPGLEYITPGAITAGPDGALWFTEPRRGKIGRITVQGQITEFFLPGSMDYLSGAITAGPDGALWFTELDRGKIGRITVQGQITEFGVLAVDAYPDNITVGPDGALWFTEFGGIRYYTPLPPKYPGNNGRIGRVTVQGQITEFALPDPESIPYNITMGPDEALWFTESPKADVNPNTIGRLRLPAPV